MVSDFDLALRELCKEDVALTDLLLALLSGPTRAESALFAAQWGQISVARRREITLRLADLGEQSFEVDFAALLRHCLNDPDPEVRRTAVRGLWEDETPALLEALLRMLTSDPDVTVRSAAATGLGSFVFAAECEELDAKRALAIRQALEQTIADPQVDLEVRRHAVEAISFINDEAVRRIIDQAYAHDDERMRVSAIFAMGRSADPFWADTVLAELADGAPKMRFEAARACGELQLRRAIGTLAKLAQGADRDLASASIWSLGQIGGKRARAVLVTLAESEDDEVVEWAVQALDEAEFAIRAMDLLAVDPENKDFEEEELAAEDEEDDFLDEEDDDELDLDGEAEWSDEFLDLDEDE